MSGEKYIGLEVHQATLSAAVMDPMGKVIQRDNDFPNGRRPRF